MGAVDMVELAVLYSSLARATREAAFTYSAGSPASTLPLRSLLMSHFMVELNEDGTIKQVYKDGEPYNQRLTLEQPPSIVKTYFLASHRNYRAMEGEEEQLTLRIYGVQAFLMALLGLEAFMNVFFHIHGYVHGKADVVELADSRTANIETKLSHLPRRGFDTPLPDQKALNRKMRELYDLRSSIAHPKLHVSTMAMPGFVFDGMVENAQGLFQDREFVVEAIRWCLFAVARVGLIASPNFGWFVDHWTGIHETNDTLSALLGVSAVPGEL